MKYDYVVVGSGCTGAMVAQTLVDAGVQVAMLDVGLTNPTYDQDIPKSDFIKIRQTDKNQYKYFIGEKAEGIVWGKMSKGEQITPPRKHITESVNHLLPTISENFVPMESLGYGGLGIGWGIGCWVWSKEELKAAGLNVKTMSHAYEVVSKRIGISASKDSAAAYSLGTLKSYLPSTKLDRNHHHLYANYLTQEASFLRRGFTMGRAPLALLTRPQDSRLPYSYKGMDFYSDKEQSAWRPWMTVNMLKKRNNFHYINHTLVISFRETKQGIEINTLDTLTNKTKHYMAKKLILAPGVLGTARIVLRSIGSPKDTLPLLCNPYVYVPCLQPRLVGRDAESKKLGFAQLSLFLDENHDNFDVAMASIYSYQSLMLFRLVRQVPINFAEARKLLQFLVTGLVIMGIHHPDSPSPNKYMSLIRDLQSPTKDKLKIAYALSSQEEAIRKRREKKYLAAMRKLGAYPLKRVDPGFGSSIHYAGALPYSKEKRPLSLSPTGKLHGTQAVYVADASGLTYLPAKGLTFSIMANAHLVAQEALRNG